MTWFMMGETRIFPQYLSVNRTYQEWLRCCHLINRHSILGISGCKFLATNNLRLRILLLVHRKGRSSFKLLVTGIKLGVTEVNSEFDDDFLIMIMIFHNILQSFTLQEGIFNVFSNHGDPISVSRLRNLMNEPIGLVEFLTRR